MIKNFQNQKGNNYSAMIDTIKSLSDILW